MVDNKSMKQALVEVEEILDNLDEEEYDKIPEDIIEYIEKNKASDYEWEYDESKKLNEQDLNEYTLSVLAFINNEYLLDEEQKKLMEEIYRQNDKASQKTIEIRTDIKNDIFEESRKEIEEKVEAVKNANLELVEVKEAKWYKKIIDKILNFFSRK